MSTSPNGLHGSGIDPGALAALRSRVRREVDEGRLPSCQIAVARHGEVLVHETYGDAPVDARYVVFSATKPVVASAIWLLLADGSLRLDTRIVEVIEQFGSNGKDVITLEQVLLHTSGFPHAPLGHPRWLEREERLAAFERWRCNWEPASRFEYHATSAHWVLAELIERIARCDYREFIRNRVLEPLGLHRFELGCPEANQHDVMALERRGTPATAEELAAVGIGALPVTEVTPESLMLFGRTDVRALGVPGGGGISDAATLARFYQALLHDPHELWEPGLLAEATGTIRNRFPTDMGVPANRTIGLVVAGDDGRSNLRGMGRTVSARAFGHNGAGGQVAFADPETGVSFVYLTNGLDEHALREWRRSAAIASHAGSLVPR